MSSYRKAPAASVNILWVGKWDMLEVLKFVKVYQDREAFEGRGERQFKAMNSIINKKKLSGKQLEKIDTNQQIRKLFEFKINSVTARVLLDGLNMERSMFHKKELSKSLMKKWKPRFNEKIRLIEMKYKPPYRS
eukprot:117081_1